MEPDIFKIYSTGGKKDAQVFYSLDLEKIFLRNVMNLFFRKKYFISFSEDENKYNEFFKNFFDSQIYLIIKKLDISDFHANEILKKILLSIFEFKKNENGTLTYQLNFTKSNIKKNMKEFTSYCLEFEIQEEDALLVIISALINRELLVIQVPLGLVDSVKNLSSDNSIRLSEIPLDSLIMKRIDIIKTPSVCY